MDGVKRGKKLAVFIASGLIWLEEERVRLKNVREKREKIRVQTVNYNYLIIVI